MIIIISCDYVLSFIFIIYCSYIIYIILYDTYPVWKDIDKDMVKFSISTGMLAAHIFRGIPSQW